MEHTELTQTLLEKIHSSWITHVVYAAVELNLPELLAHKPLKAEELAIKSATPVETLKRLLGALVTLDIIQESHQENFSLTEIGQRLRADHPESIRSWVIWWTTNLRDAWGQILYSVKTGNSARSLLHGVEGFAHLDQDSKQAAIFNQALVELTRLTALAVVDKYDFSQFKTVMDVGGGYGELLRTILLKNPRIFGILFDRPHALGGALDRFRQRGIAERCKFIEGDFFEPLTEGADALILKSILHDWKDDKAILILNNCRKVLSSDAKLLLIERVMPEKLQVSIEHQDLVRSDLTMLVALGAKERTENEYRELLHKSGFEVERIIPVGMTHSVVEAIPIT